MNRTLSTTNIGRSAVRRVRAKWRFSIKCLVFFCAASVLFTRCYDNSEEEIPIEGNICLFKNEGTNGGYCVALKHDEHVFYPLVEPNPLVIYYTPSRIFVIQDDNNIRRYNLIILKKDASDLPRVVELKKERFDKEVKDCASCKKIQLVLDTAQGRWVVKR